MKYKITRIWYNIEAQNMEEAFGLAKPGEHTNVEVEVQHEWGIIKMEKQTILNWFFHNQKRLTDYFEE